MKFGYLSRSSIYLWRSVSEAQISLGKIVSEHFSVFGSHITVIEYIVDISLRIESRHISEKLRHISKDKVSAYILEARTYLKGRVSMFISESRYLSQGLGTSICEAQYAL